MSKRPVIIDTDPGVDDFFAILLAASSPELEIRAITAVAGNCPLAVTSRNALAITERYGLSIPVAKGAAQPMNTSLHTAEYIHGKQGLGNLTIEEPTGAFCSEYAWDVIYREAVKHSGSLEIVALGPLTNIAIALVKYPDLADRIKRIVFMGGSTDTGNVTPYAEFNIYVDPLAADIVLQSGIDLVMVGLNTTTRTLLEPQDIKLLTTGDSMICQDCRTLANGLQQAYHKEGFTNGIALHDALAVAYAIDSSVLHCEKLAVMVERRSPMNLGRTIVEIDRVNKPHAKNCHVALSAEKDCFVSLLRDMIGFYAERKIK